MKINNDFIEKIKLERNLQQVLKNLVLTTAAVRDLQIDMAAIKAKLGILERSEVVNAEES